MKSFDFYEFAGVLAPGAVALFGMTIIYPNWQGFSEAKQFSLGDLGLFVVLAYVAGHLTQSLGNALEFVFWQAQGGMPTDWVRTGRYRLLAPAQQSLLIDHIARKLGVSVPDKLQELDRKSWSAITSQVYAAVRAAGCTARTDIFNANYGMFRGIASALIVVIGAILFEHHLQFPKAIIMLIIGTLLALARMRRFGRHYARELFVQFLQLKAETHSTATSTSSGHA